MLNINIKERKNISNSLLTKQMNILYTIIYLQWFCCMRLPANKLDIPNLSPTHQIYAFGWMQWHLWWISAWQLHHSPIDCICFLQSHSNHQALSSPWLLYPWILSPVYRTLKVVQNTHISNMSNKLCLDIKKEV